MKKSVAMMIPNKGHRGIRVLIRGSSQLLIPFEEAAIAYGVGVANIEEAIGDVSLRGKPILMERLEGHKFLTRPGAFEVGEVLKGRSEGSLYKRFTRMQILIDSCQVSHMSRIGTQGIKKAPECIRKAIGLLGPKAPEAREVQAMLPLVAESNEEGDATHQGVCSPAPGFRAFSKKDGAHPRGPDSPGDPGAAMSLVSSALEVYEEGLDLLQSAHRSMSDVHQWSIQRQTEISESRQRESALADRVKELEDLNPVNDGPVVRSMRDPGFSVLLSGVHNFLPRGCKTKHVTNWMRENGWIHSDQGDDPSVSVSNAPTKAAVDAGFLVQKKACFKPTGGKTSRIWAEVTLRGLDYLVDAFKDFNPEDLDG